MLSPVTIRIGSIVQVDPESKYKRYRACLAFVKSIDSNNDLLNCIIVIPDDRGTRLEEVAFNMDGVEYIACPKWCPEECIPEKH